MSHTKGPWISDGNGFVGSYNISNHEKSICDVDVSSADARLMAAAPEMLEALELILNDNRLMNAMTGGQAKAIMYSVAKARGE